jgi:hypothetical protein
MQKAEKFPKKFPQPVPMHFLMSGLLLKKLSKTVTKAIFTLICNSDDPPFSGLNEVKRHIWHQNIDHYLQFEEEQKRSPDLFVQILL